MASLLKFDILSAVFVLCLSFACAERDFNFNDSQISIFEPKDEPINRNYQDPYAAEVSRCHYTQSEIVLSLVLKNRDWSDLSDNKKSKVLDKLSKFFAIPKEFIIMESVTKRDMYEMQKQSIRKGNNKCHNNRRLGRVDFMIGCGPKYLSMGEPIANQIGQQMKDGSIDNISGQRFGWWIIWRKSLKPRSERNRRQIEGSGEDEFDDDSYDYDDDDEEENVEPVTEIPTTTAHPHRHHHGVSKPDLIESSSNELTNNNVDAVAANTLLSSLTNVSSSTGHGDGNTNSNNNSSSNSPPVANNIDEEIVESVSQLESVITKTIENTKHIKELPEPAAVEDELDADMEEEEGPDEAAVDEAVLRSAGDKNSDLRAFAETSTTRPDEATATAAGDSSRISSSSKLVGDSVVDPNESTAAAAAVASAVTVAFDRQTTTTGTSTISPFSTLLTNSSTPSPPSPPPPPQSPSSSSYEALLSSSLPPPHASSSSVVVVSSYPSTLSPSSSSSSTTTMQSKKQNPQHDVENVAVSLLKTGAEGATSSPGIDMSTNQTTIQTSTATLIVPITTTTAATTKSLPITTRSSFLQLFTLSTAKTRNLTTNVVATTEQLTNASTITSDRATTLPSSSSLPSPSPSLSSSTVTTTATATPSPLFLFTSDHRVKDESEDVLLPEDHHNTSNADVSAATTPQYSDVPVISSTVLATIITSSAAPPVIVATNRTTSTPTPTTSLFVPSPAIQVTTENTAPIITSTEYVEPKVENSPPMIKTRLQKFAVTSGKAFRYVVPSDNFYDTEDLTNLRLELTDKDGQELKPSSWLQFNAETHEIYGLPLDDAVSKWQYRLTATDSGNLSVTETLEMSVQQHRGVRSVNHEIKIEVKIHEKNTPNIDWQMKLITAITSVLHDDSSTNLVVREIRQAPQDPVTATFSYFNETLPTSGACPDAELNTLVRRLDVDRLTDLVSPTLSVKLIAGQLIGPCLKQHVSPKPKPPTHLSKNLPPMPRNQVDRVNATVGHLLVFKVPGDTFYDQNDNDLVLSLKTKDNKELNPRHWLQFDSKNQEFYGIPKSGDIGSEEYLLVAEDSGGLSATDALVVVVNHAPKKEFSVYFKAYLAIRHEQFNADLQRKFVERLAQLFGDRTTQLIQIRSVTTHHDADGTIVNFYNTSLHKTHNRCPEEEIEATRSVYLMQDYKVRDRVKQALGAELNLTNVQVNPLGSCHPQPNVILHDVIPTKTEEPTLKSTFADNYMFTFIVPAVIIVALILVASIIACCLHRRRMSGKMEIGDEEERKAFRTKGIPVIFQDELDEKPEIGNKSPIILKDEKPPLLPPSYNTSNMNGENEVDEYVAPPALVVGGREVRGKSPATPSYRKPPPYVSP